MRELLLSLSTPILAFIFAGAFLLLWGRDRARRENLWFSLGWALLGTGFSISLLSPDHWGRAIVMITHGPYTLAAVAMSIGLLKRIGVASPVRAHILIAATGFGVLAFVQSFGNSIVGDLLVTNLTCGVILVMTAQLCARAGRRDRVETFLMVMIILAAAQFFIRPVMTLMFDGPVAAEAYRETVYYLAFNWIFAFGSVLFGLAQMAGAVKDQFNDLRADTSTDTLSGLLSRGEFEARVEEALAQAAIQNTDVALVVADLDHFKTVNDIWGHQAGDAAIADFGRVVASFSRASDIAGRVGGEEFCILVSNAGENAAYGLAERLRARTNELEVDGGHLSVRLTASFGVAGRQAGESYRSLFARADKALYQAKQNGRDRVEKASELAMDAAPPAGDNRDKAAA